MESSADTPEETSRAHRRSPKTRGLGTQTLRADDREWQCMIRLAGQSLAAVEPVFNLSPLVLPRMRSNLYRGTVLGRPSMHSSRAGFQATRCKSVGFALGEGPNSASSFPLVHFRMIVPRQLRRAACTVSARHSIQPASIHTNLVGWSATTGGSVEWKRRSSHVLSSDPALCEHENIWEYQKISGRREVGRHGQRSGQLPQAQAPAAANDWQRGSTKPCYRECRSAPTCLEPGSGLCRSEAAQLLHRALGSRRPPERPTW